MKPKTAPAVLAWSFLMCVGALAQAPSTAQCVIDAPTFNTNAANIFNDRQEQDLGDALAEYFESDLRIASPAANDDLTRIGQKLLATLPESGIHFRFRIYESGDVNGFSLAGGRVYISRKMVAAVKNEDELAGVVAHELGHLTTHQTAIEMTRIFRIRLGVTQVGDRADIFAKVHQLLSTPEKSQEGEPKEEKDQLVADRVALYAMVKAGYAPESFASFLNQSMNNKGKTGNWLTDVFGLTHEESQRYRRALKLIDSLPANCHDRKPAASTEFAAWQADTVGERVQTAANTAKGDQPITLDSPLRPALWRVLFSPDGRYLLAQDESSIAVVEFETLKVLFRIDAPDVEAAYFTPDSQNIVFHDTNLRVEKWSVATQKRVTAKELVLFDGCRQSLLSSDGRTLVCVNMREGAMGPQLSARMIDVETGSPIFEKQGFYRPLDYQAYFLRVRNATGSALVNVHVSQDGRYLLLIKDKSTLAFDFRERQPVALGGKLKGLSDQEMSFVGPDQLFVVHEGAGKLFKAEILTFPDGAVVKDSQIGNQWLMPASKGRTLIIGPVKEHPVAFYDPDQGKLLGAWNQFAVDVWDDRFAGEAAMGTLKVGQLGKPLTDIILPMGRMPRPVTVAFSEDGKYLSISLRGRAEVWDLTTGKLLEQLRPLSRSWITPDDHLLAQEPQYHDLEPNAVDVSFSPLSITSKGKVEFAAFQFHDLVVSYKPIKPGQAALDFNVRMEVRKFGDDKVLWTHDFVKDRPGVGMADDGRFVLAWDLNSDAAKLELKANPKLQKDVAELNTKKKGMLLETLSPQTGAAMDEVALPEVDLTGGMEDVRGAIISGNYVLVRGEHDNTDIYRMDDGSKLGELFGLPLTSDPVAGIVVTANREAEVILSNEQTGKEIERFTMGAPVVAAHIPAKEKVLLVLTDDQVLHRVPLPVVQ